jgi:dienelactone hydrolase
MKKISLALFALTLLITRTADAKVIGKDVTYKQGKTVLVGYVAYDDAATGKHPAVLVVHDWMGVSDETKRRVEMLAGLGYVAFAADVYGKGVRPKSMDDAGKEAGKYKGDRALYRARVKAALDTMTAMAQVDKTKVAAIGYCFGGMGALELARMGLPLAGVVTFHGSLDADAKATSDLKKYKGKVLVLHGADDPYVNGDVVAALGKELKDAGIDYQIVLYGGAVHAFTNPGAGNDPSKGAAYDEKADKRSWEAMKQFMVEIFGT